MQATLVLTLLVAEGPLLQVRTSYVNLPLVIPVNSSALGRRIPLLQHLAALAVVHGLSKRIRDGDVQLRLKWPNDIYLKTAGEEEGDLVKMGGVLAMSSLRGNEAVCNVGVGFNLDNESPTLSLNGILERGDKMRKEEYFATVFNALEELVDMMERGREEEGCNSIDI